jgi:hypothetical protein
MALMTAGGAPTAPALPAPFQPLAFTAPHRPRPRGPKPDTSELKPQIGARDPGNSQSMFGCKARWPCKREGIVTARLKYRIGAKQPPCLTHPTIPRRPFRPKRYCDCRRHCRAEDRSLSSLVLASLSLRRPIKSKLHGIPARGPFASRPGADDRNRSIPLAANLEDLIHWLGIIPTSLILGATP